MKINWKNPKTEIEFVFLTMLLWRDIYRNKLSRKSDSKYFAYVKEFTEFCPLCQYYGNCKKCCLSGNINSDDYMPCTLFFLWIGYFDVVFTTGESNHKYPFNPIDFCNKYAKEIFGRCRDKYLDLLGVDK